MSQTGPEHAKTFVVRAVWEGIELGQGTGKSKKQAEIVAAIEAMTERRWENLKIAASD
jgi:ribonuclease III